MAIALFKVTDFGTNRKRVRDFPLVNTTDSTVSKLLWIISQIFTTLDRGVP